MLAHGANIVIPEWFCRLCQMNLHNSKRTYTDLADLIQSDPFLKIYVYEVFSDFLKKGGLNGMLTALGWEGIRNRLAEVVLHKFATGNYPKVLDLDHVEGVIEFEKRFDFMFTEGNSRLFLLGVYLKACDLKSEGHNDSELVIPVELDEVIQDVKNRSEFPDWLLYSFLSLMQVLGADTAIAKISKNKSNIDEIFSSLSSEQSDQYLGLLLRYGHGIRHQEFFTESKVL